MIIGCHKLKTFFQQVSLESGTFIHVMPFREKKNLI